MQRSRGACSPSNMADETWKDETRTSLHMLMLSMSILVTLVYFLKWRQWFKDSPSNSHACIFFLSVLPEKAYEAKAMAEQGVAMAKDKCKVQWDGVGEWVSERVNKMGNRWTAELHSQERWKEGREEGRKIEVRAIGTQRSLVAELVNALGDTRRAFADWSERATLLKIWNMTCIILEVCQKIFLSSFHGKWLSLQLSTSDNKLPEWMNAWMRKAAHVQSRVSMAFPPLFLFEKWFPFRLFISLCSSSHYSVVRISYPT